MSRYQLLKDLTDQGKPVYLPYVMLGFPDMKYTVEICKALIEEGVQGFELGFPFRDPVADGPVVQDAANEALDNGFKTAKAVDLVRQIRALNDDIPLTAMSYFNMVLARGPEQFIKEFSEAGLDGLLIPDMPPERADEISPIAKKYGIELVFIAAPNSDERRLDLIRQYAGGFIYVVTRLGITGVQNKYSDQLTKLFENLHKHIPLPAIAGFGISEPEQAMNMVKAGADGVITGSRLIELIREGAKGDTLDLAPLKAHTRAMIEKFAA